MKKLVISICIITVTGLIAYNYLTTQGLVTQEEFRNAHELLNKKIDSLTIVTKRIDSNVISIRKNIDTLKNGQRIIYDEVRKKNISFWDKF